MPSLEEVEARWQDILAAPYPSDRATAEDGIRHVYRAAGVSEPHQFLWFDNPRDASMAAELLSGSDTGEIPTSPSRRECIRATREKLIAATGVQSWGAVRPWIGPSVSEKLSQFAWAVLHRYPQRNQAETKAMTKRFYQRALRWMGSHHGIVGKGVSLSVSGEALNLDAGMVTLQLVQGGVDICTLAVCDYLELRDEPIPSLLAVARNCFNWWPFEGAAVICARHVAAARDDQGRWHSAAGPAVEYPDGWGVYAMAGDAIPGHWVRSPERFTIAEIQGRHDPLRQAGIALYGSERFEGDLREWRECIRVDSAILREDLPPDASARIERYRQYQASLPFYDRYLAGDHAGVWRELQALGAHVRQDPFAADALAVATETMARVASNAQRLVERLADLGYEFETESAAADEEIAQLEESLRRMNDKERTARMYTRMDPAARESMERLRGENIPKLEQRLQELKATARNCDVRALNAPAADIGKQIREVEKRLGPLPLSLRTFWEVTGDLNFRGNHSALNEYEGVVGDPLVVNPMVQFGMLPTGDGLEISEDACFKARYSGGESYSIGVPSPSMDGRLWGEPHELMFVDYLRLAFRYGGFAGWEGKPRPPKEIDALTSGLILF